jgi:hypothetical protein
MTLKTPTVIALSLLLSGCATSHQQADVSDLGRAVAIASLAAEQEGYPLQEYTLTSAQRIAHQGQYIWRITFKPSNLLPKDPSKGPFGLGGELFVNVDLGTGQSVITFGE